MIRVHPIQTGTVAVHERQREGAGRGPTRLLRTLADRSWTAPLPILAWAIEHPEGLIVVDTGETARASQPGYLPAWNPYFRLAVRIDVAPQDEIGPALERLGLAPGDVRKVVLTHLHTDHAGGLHHLRAGEQVVTRTELAFASGAKGRARGYVHEHWPAWFDPAGVEIAGPAFGPFAHSLPLTAAGDVVLLPTPGHTLGHASVAVRLDDRLVLLAGDTSYTQALMFSGAADGVTQDPATSRRTLALIRALAAAEPTVYLPSHDPDSVRRLADLEPVPPAAL
ncbi:MAG: N-acyl homoserine lactonase family protein [Solirubrobacteraceae bacterium]